MLCSILNHLWRISSPRAALYVSCDDTSDNLLDPFQPEGNLAPRVCAAVAVVAVVFIVVQYGSSSETTLWLINRGASMSKRRVRAAVGVVVVMLVFVYNVIETAYAARRITGITAIVLMIDLVPIILLT